MRILKLGITVFFFACPGKSRERAEGDRRFRSPCSFLGLQDLHVGRARPLSGRSVDGTTHHGCHQRSAYKQRLARGTGRDIGIVAHVATRRKHTLETFYDGFPGPWRWGLGWGEAITTSETYTIGTVVVDLFDTTTKQLIWRGVGSETLSEKPQKDTEKLNKTVEKMFKNFPPRNK
jgi:hypothetical protein